ncbi:MAG: 4'-phosphopantetheinyl transferase superfamily protein [Acidimicrobiales bacterium]
MSPTDVHGALGIDIEVDGSLPLEDSLYVSSVDERRTAVHVLGAGVGPAVMWSAKESAFKCWSHALDGDLGPVEPLDIEITLSDAAARRESGVFHARCGTGPRTRHPSPLQIEGRWCRESGLVVTVCSVSTGDPALSERRAERGQRGWS